LVVVTLKGTIPAPCRLALETSEFAAIYEKITTNGEGEKKSNVSIELSSGFAKGDSWAIPPAGSRSTTTYYIQETGNILIKVVFALPEDVNDFLFAIRHLQTGKPQFHHSVTKRLKNTFRYFTRIIYAYINLSPGLAWK